jgi:iron complex transport system substrate-binding protein
VVQTALSNDAESRIQDILLIGYIYGEEERALELAQEVQERLDQLWEVVAWVGETSPRVIALTRYFDSIWTAGIDSTEGGIIEAAGALNVAAEAGIESNQTTSLEGVISMEPEIIIIPQPAEFGAGEFLDDLLADASLAAVPAVRDGRVYVVESRYFTTLSFWNLIGIEQLGRLLWPETFEGEDFGSFSSPGAD